MSFMPSPGTRVRLRDGHAGVVTKVTPSGDDDRVRLDDGNERRVSAWDIDEILGDEVETSKPKGPS
jgi:hypothetical protein